MTDWHAAGTLITVVEAERFDAGDKLGYLMANGAALRHPQIGSAFERYLADASRDMMSSPSGVLLPDRARPRPPRDSDRRASWLGGKAPHVAMGSRAVRRWSEAVTGYHLCLVTLILLFVHVPQLYGSWARGRPARAVLPPHRHLGLSGSRAIVIPAWPFRKGRSAVSPDARRSGACS
jgi:hypothetical protein